MMLLLFSVGLQRSKTIFPSLICVRLQNTEVSGYRGYFLHESVCKCHFGHIGEDSELHRCRIIEVQPYMQLYTKAQACKLTFNRLWIFKLQMMIYI